MVRRRLVVFAIGSAASALSALAACISDDEGAPPTALPDANTFDVATTTTEAGTVDVAPPVDAGGDDLGPLRAFCDTFAKATCDRRAFCSGGSSDPGCESREVASCHLYARAELLPAMNGGHITFDSTRANDCFASPPADFCATNTLFSLTACRDIFVGTVDRGGPCFPVYFLAAGISVCKSGTCSATPGDSNCTPGTCIPYTDAGAPCTDDAGAPIAPGCGLDALCDPTTHTCVPTPGLHMPCTALGQQCSHFAPFTSCVPLADGGDAGFECDYARDAGAACGAPGGAQMSIACRSLVCENDKCVDTNDAGRLICLSAESRCAVGTTCQSGAPYPSCGTPFGAGHQCNTAYSAECAAGLECVAASDGGTCVALPTLGQTCANECAAGLVCADDGSDAGTKCLQVLATGATCARAADPRCAGGDVCLQTTHVCGKPLSLGTTCAADQDCDPGLYCADDTKRCSPWKRNGAPCASNHECVYGNACNDAGVCTGLCTLP